MKFKSILSATLAMLLATSASKAAVFVVSNVGDLSTDRLYAYNNNSLMNTTTGGVVVVGYFSAGITSTDINTASKLYSNLSNFTVMSSASPGAPMGALSNAAANGYADNSDTAASSGLITGSNTLINRVVYSIVTNAASIASGDTSTLFSNSTLQLGLVQIGTIVDEGGGEQTYSSNPTNTPIVGSLGTFNGNVGFGNGTYSTFKMDVIPEPSSLILASLGVLALLRRKR